MKKISLILICFVMLFSMVSCEFMSMLDSVMNSSSSNEKPLKSEESSSEDSSLHEHIYDEKTVSPTCENDGYVIHECECGYYFFDDFTDKTEHEYTDAVCTKCRDVDYKELVNIISTETISSTFGITVEYKYKSGLFAETVAYSSGSGVAVKHEDGKYYVLTNNHVVYNADLESSNTSKEYYVIDYLGNKHKATLIARKAEYDLAIVCFTSIESFPVLTIEKENPTAEEAIVSIGYPKGQANTVTLGIIERYQKVNMSASSEANIEFETLQHDAYINDGSSGGALLNVDLNIIGINFAGNKNQDTGEHLSSFAIPAEQIYNFFEEIEFSVE